MMSWLSEISVAYIRQKEKALNEEHTHTLTLTVLYLVLF